MNIIYTTKLRDVQSAFNDFNENSYAYDLINQLHSSNTSQLEFARPIFKGDEIRWISRINDLELKSISELDFSNQQEIRSIIRKETNGIRESYEKLRDKRSPKWIDNIFEIPSSDKCIFIGQRNDAFHIVLCEWGFRKTGFDPPTGVLNDYLNKNFVSLSVKVESERGKPQANHKVLIRRENGVIEEFDSNGEGIVSIPSMPAGEELTISSGVYPDVVESFKSQPHGAVTLKVPVVEQPPQKEIEETKDDPPPPPPPPHKEHFIQLVDKKNRPIISQQVTIAEESIGSNQTNRRDYTSDSNGHLKNFVFDNSKSYRISTRYRMSNWEGDIQQNQSSDVTAVKIPYVFPWLWVLLGIFFFMMWFIPFVPIAHSYVVKDINGNRVENQVVKCLLLDKKDAKTLAQETNSMGQASFDLGSVSLFRYVFWPRQVKGSANDVFITSEKAPFVSPVDTLCVGVVPE